MQQYSGSAVCGIDAFKSPALISADAIVSKTKGGLLMKMFCLLFLVAFAARRVQSKKNAGFQYSIFLPET